MPTLVSAFYWDINVTNTVQGFIDQGKKSFVVSNNMMGQGDPKEGILKFLVVWMQDDNGQYVSYTAAEGQTMFLDIKS